MLAFFPRTLPQGLEPLTDLALDLRWTWSHAGDRLWRTVAPDVWERTENPWIILQDVSEQRLEQLAADSDFTAEVARLAHERDLYLSGTASFQRQYTDTGIHGIAYFSMEFGLGEGLPLYAGGLGILAGDYLKAASDLGLPLVGVGLLFADNAPPAKPIDAAIRTPFGRAASLLKDISWKVEAADRAKRVLHRSK